MGELAEALRRANDEAAHKERAARSGERSESSARTLSLDEVLGRREAPTGPSEQRAADAGDEPVSPSQATPARPARSTEPAGQRKEVQQPTIRAVAREAGAARAERISLLDDSTIGAACARRIAQKLKRRAAPRNIRSIVITSSLRGEGKTTTACNIAIALTRLDRSESVVLVDLDLRRPSVAKSLGLQPVHTVNEVLDRRASLDDALLVTDVPGLSVLATDRGTSSPEPLLASQNLRSLIEQLERRFSRVIIDSPPALVVADASSAIDAADAYVFVAKAGSTPTKSIKGALEHLPREKMLGSVLNHAHDAKAMPTEYYYYGEKDANAMPGAPDAPADEVAR
ncbi:MAG: CpsD/CapB family tyrosine-protein kinase [Myxococcota bacterium]